MKFKRAYELFINPYAKIFLPGQKAPTIITGNTLIISNPAIKNGTNKPGIGVKFRIERGINNSNNTADFELFNLNSVSREYLRRDFFQIPNERYNSFVIFRAGYVGVDNQKKIFNQIFTGDLMEGGSSKNGTEVITKFDCQEQGYANTSSKNFINQSFNTGVTGQTLLQTLLSSLGFNFDNLEASNETKSTLLNPLGAQVLVGNGLTLLKEKYGQTFFVDLNTPCLLNTNEIRGTIVPIITSTTGLIGTPFREQTKVIVKMIFEPRIILGQGVEIKSNVTPEFNGIYKVVGIKHEGTISPSQEGECTTTLELFIGTQTLGAFKTIN